MNFFLLLFCSCILIGCTTEESSIDRVPNKVVTNKTTTVGVYSYDNFKAFLEAENDTTYVVNFWATWCLPCRVEMPSLDRLQSIVGDNQFQVVIVAVERTSFSKINDFLREIEIKNLVNFHDPSTMAGKHINATGLPITVLFDKSGQELGRYNGDFEWDSNEVINYITQLKNS